MSDITKEINPGSFSTNKDVKLILEYIKWKLDSDTLNYEELRVAYYLRDNRIFDFKLYKSKLYINSDVFIEMRVDFISEEYGVLNFREDIKFKDYFKVVKYVNTIKISYDAYLEWMKTQPEDYIIINT
jgi:hypothetical protein